MKTSNDIGFIWEQTHKLNTRKHAIVLFVPYGKKLRPEQMKESGFFWSDVDGPIDAPRLIPGGSVCGFKTSKGTFTKNGVAGSKSQSNIDTWASFQSTILRGRSGRLMKVSVVEQTK